MERGFDCRAERSDRGRIRIHNNIDVSVGQTRHSRWELISRSAGTSVLASVAMVPALASKETARGFPHVTLINMAPPRVMQ